ncbi:MAG: hypothetical protein J5379_06640 [Clostridiales bacterium]|nr:hypothetical protein [Clostridiales bacterium]
MNEKVKKRVRRLSAWALSAVMGVALIPSVTAPKKVQAAWKKSANNTTIGVSGISNPNPSVFTSTSWSGDYVYFGNYEGSPMRFRVLNTDETKYGGHTLFLDSDTVLYSAYFDSIRNDWANSTLKSDLNGSGFLNKSGVFTSLEKAAIKGSTVSAHDLVNNASLPSLAGQVTLSVKEMFKRSTALTGEKIFLLDVEELCNVAYGYFYSDLSNARSKKMIGSSTTHDYWTRSPDPDSANYMKEGYIGGSGGINMSYYVDSIKGVSPAMNLDRNKIILSSAISTREYKLTLKDKDIAIKPSSSSGVAFNGNTVTIPYTITGTNAGNVNTVSVLILEKTKSNTSENNILYYAPLSGTVASEGSGTFTLPSSLDVSGWGEDYYVYILAEDVNGDKETDYAGEPAEICLPKDYVVDISSGELYPNITYDTYLAIFYHLGDLNLVRYEYVEGNIYEDIDLDKDGNVDIRFTFEGFLSYVRLPSCNIFGDYTYKSSELLARGYKSITIKLPKCKTSITKAEPTDTGVQVKWSQVKEYSAYNVYRSDSQNGSYSYLASVTNGSCKYVDKTAKGGKTYYYKIRPYTKVNGKTHYAPWSEAKKVTVLADTKLTAEPKSGVTMKLSWTAVSGATSYEIYRSTSASGPYTYVKATTGTSTSDTGLTAGTRYYYMVCAKKTVNGEAQYSKYSAAVAVALATPTMESATFKSGKGVTLTWTKASGADRYNVYKYNTSTGGYDYVASVLGGTLTYTDASGKKGDYYKVRAYKRVDGVVYYGGWSNAKAGK